MEKAKVYRVDIDGHNKFHGLNKEFFEPGEFVRFYVMLPTDTSVYVKAEGVRLEEEDLVNNCRYYTFSMPENDVKVEITYRSCMMKSDYHGFMGMGMPMGNMLDYNGKVPPNPQAPTNKAKGKFCPECGAPNELEAKYCSECGRKF